MSLLLESVKIHKNKPQHLYWHEQRLNRSRQALFGRGVPLLSLTDVINCSGLDERLTYKARVIAGLELEKVEIRPYQVKPLRSVKLIEANNFFYQHKFADRSALDELLADRGEADEVLIVCDGLVTDTSYANVCLWDGTCWTTPAKPLLEGTCRARLLQEGAIRTANIRIEDLRGFEKICLINAMLGLGDVVLPVGKIIY